MTSNDKPRHRRTDALERQRRLQAVEEMLYGGYRPQQIHILLKERFPVTRGTIRNDIVEIRKNQKEVTTEASVEVKDEFIGRLHAIRRAAMKGWRDPDGRVKGRDFRLAHDIDKTIASVLGLKLASDNPRITITMEAAQSYIEHVMDIIAQNVRDPDDRARVLAAIESEANARTAEPAP
jgi:hypothetical protein